MVGGEADAHEIVIEELHFRGISDPFGDDREAPCLETRGDTCGYLLGVAAMRPIQYEGPLHGALVLSPPLVTAE